MKQSSSRTLGQPTGQPSNAIHRISEVVSGFQSLNSSSAANQAKTEYRRGEFLEQLVTQKYPAAVAEEHIQFIRDSFTSFNERIRELHMDVPEVPKRRGKKVKNDNIDNSMSAETDGEKAMVADDDKDSDYNEDGGAASPQLTAEQEAEDEEHWRQEVNALTKDTNMTKYFVEMGYQMPSSLPKEGLKVQDQQENLVPRRKSLSKRWVPRLINNNKRASLPPPNIGQRFEYASPHNNAQEQEVDTTRNLPGSVVPSLSNPSIPPSKRAKTASLSSTRPHSGPKLPPRCASCVQMKKNCDRKTPCGRCSGMRDYKACNPYWRDVQRSLEAEQ
ncbi:hypothetical protein BOTCAL_0327g00120 [Botryotinia calthae]|uniref:Zn(2)-C6 fungal-type domain-containing protein n=1 Tax=Botryotinia calthae TaxID=38488 RepID=A0A4Y8CU05_9HELO|nr:hypothetical protein BOTCAL_0327g00120 [Botryotinia calthae]